MHQGISLTLRLLQLGPPDWKGGTFDSLGNPGLHKAFWKGKLKEPNVATIPLSCRQYEPHASVRLERGCSVHGKVYLKRCGMVLGLKVDLDASQIVVAS